MAAGVGAGVGAGADVPLRAIFLASARREEADPTRWGDARHACARRIRIATTRVATYGDVVSVARCEEVEASLPPAKSRTAVRIRLRVSASANPSRTRLDPGRRAVGGRNAGRSPGAGSVHTHAEQTDRPDDGPASTREGARSSSPDEERPQSRRSSLWPEPMPTSRRAWAARHQGSPGQADHRWAVRITSRAPSTSRHSQGRPDHMARRAKARRRFARSTRHAPSGNREHPAASLIRPRPPRQGVADAP